MRLGEFDRSGRRRPVPSEDGQFTIDADQVIVAVGQSLPHSVLLNGLELKLTPSGFVASSICS